MAPSHSRQLLVWTLPTIAVALSYLWYRKKRIGAQSDTGGEEQKNSNDSQETTAAAVAVPEPPCLSRSLSGVDSAPIDIVIPPELRSVKSNPVVISDEDLDLEIEKIKSMKNGGSGNSSSMVMSRSKSETSPIMKNHNNNNSIISAVKGASPQPIIDSNGERTPVVKKKNNNNNKKGRKENDKTMTMVEEKLDSLQLTGAQQGNHNRTELQRQSSERDSANHSPADVMLASPSLSSISDNHSEGSSDSGKGGSDVATPPPSRTPATMIDDTGCDLNNVPSFYEFVIPQTLVGKLIGRHGASVINIRDKTNAQIVVKKHPTNNKLKVCSIDGTQIEIEKALKMIRDKFPLKRYPDLTLEQVSITPQMTIPLVPDNLYLKLVEGINNDTIVSCMVAPNYLFVQLPTHPSFPNLNVLTNYMNACYQETNSPLLPSPIAENTICAAHSVDSWYRAMVLSTDEESNTSYVKFLDYGGFAYVENHKLRQIRGDFMLLPFQAAECMLANIKSVNEDGSWPEEAYNLVAELTKGAIMYTQVSDYTEDGIPLVLCYVALSPQILFLNQQLVDEGFAEWITVQEEEEPNLELNSYNSNIEGAVGGILA